MGSEQEAGPGARRGTGWWHLGSFGVTELAGAAPRETHVML